MIATLLNLLILAACGCVFLWTQRRLAYYVDMIVCPILSNVLLSAQGDSLKLTATDLDIVAMCPQKKDFRRTSSVRACRKTNHG